MKLLKLISMKKNHNFRNVKPFIIGGKTGEDMSSFISMTLKTEGAGMNPGNEINALPFPEFSIEFEGDSHLDLTDTDADSPKEHHVHCIYCNELFPGKYHIMSYGTLEGIPTIFETKYDFNGMDLHRENYDSVRIPVDTGNNIYNEDVFIIDLILYLLDNGTVCGTVKMPGKANYKHGKNRKVFRPSEVVYITKNTQSKPVTECGRNIRWSKGWEVRGHWRRLQNTESIGLNRHGVREVVGYTWIKNHTVGDEKAIQTKIRIKK